MDVSDLIEAIEKAFAWRVLPDQVLEGPLPGDELEEGSLPYGVGPWKEFNLTDEIHKYIQGKSWKEVEVPNFIMAIHHVTREAFCYYLPAFMTFNLRTNDEFETLDAFLEKPSVSYSLKSRYNDGYKYEIRDQLTVEEREVVADYMSYLKDTCQFTAEDIAFWRPAP